ncbi:hypothetical protein PMIT1327_00798 [Prochlorococcus marinus str. MIT 1327]|nr:hypothetical protein PMIT1312_00427 [Prochlorococcus marinus str. MIT 1312]KZR82535.1 hypothetical protein PMIT1327_00798 [Prochlorococcus marinus str. MIT 1327]
MSKYQSIVAPLHSLLTETSKHQNLPDQQRFLLLGSRFVLFMEVKPSSKKDACLEACDEWS